MKTLIFLILLTMVSYAQEELPKEVKNYIASMHEVNQFLGKPDITCIFVYDFMAPQPRNYSEEHPHVIYLREYKCSDEHVIDVFEDEGPTQ